ncbi:MAG: hypothetical protein RL701_1452 [Pseudomonadota bacterium]|jgi:hypothetical protein
MSKVSLLLIVAAALAGATFANFARVSAEPQAAWDNDLARRLVSAEEGQEKALEALLRASEQQTRALDNIARAAERCQH